MLGTHGVDYFARRERVPLQVREGRLEVVPVFLAEQRWPMAVFKVLLTML